MIYQFIGGIEVRGQRSDHEISISVLEPRQEEINNSKRQTEEWEKSSHEAINAAKRQVPVKRRRSRNSNENAKMEANHSRNQNRKAAEVLTKKGLESKLRSMCQSFVSEQL